MQRPRRIKEAGESEELNISNRGILEMGQRASGCAGWGETEARQLFKPH